MRVTILVVSKAGYTVLCLLANLVHLSESFPNECVMMCQIMLLNIEVKADAVRHAPLSDAKDELPRSAVLDA